MFFIIDPSGKVLATSDSIADAVHSAESELGDVEIDGIEKDLRAADRTENKGGAIDAREAMRTSGLDVSGMRAGLEMDPREAWEIAVPIVRRRLERLTGRGERGWQGTPGKFGRSMIGGNLKMQKDAKNVVTEGLSLVPASQYMTGMAQSVTKPSSGQLDILNHFRGSTTGLPTWCLGSSPGCRATCLVDSGKSNTINPKGVYERRGTQLVSNPQARRLAYADVLVEAPDAFVSLLSKGISMFSANFAKKNFIPSVRLNVFQDLPWELMVPDLFQRHADVIFYDYSKIPGRTTPSNYWITFSLDERPVSVRNALSELSAGRNVAVVFLGLVQGKDGKLTTKMGYLPYEFTLGGKTYEVINGDKYDARILDPNGPLGEPGDGVIIGLTYKAPKTLSGKNAQGHLDMFEKFLEGGKTFAQSMDPQRGYKAVGGRDANPSEEAEPEAYVIFGFAMGRNFVVPQTPRSTFRG